MAGGRGQESLVATVFLALGSNVGDSGANMRKSIELLGEKVTNITEAPVYSSKAVGYTDQPDFLNTAVRGETALSPFDLLGFVKDIEQEVGRVHRFRWGPREIDIDVIFYDDQKLETPDLTIPHPRFAERDFVLRPICDIDSSWKDPVSGKTCKELLAALPTSELSILP
jgi:2-amino-4-hydroxy-6-hydroxymethyldihydropteridine diphosphokinase